MIELRRRVLRPIETGVFCKMNNSAKERIWSSDDYRSNGNVDQNHWNLDKKVHIADADLFYVVNGKPFNSENHIEVIPISFSFDSTYNPKTLMAALKIKFKVIVERKDFAIVTSPNNEILGASQLRHRMLMVSKKFKLNLNKWNMYMGSK